MNDDRFGVKVVGFLFLFGIISAPAFSQVVTDGTTGPGQALAGPDYQIGAELGTKAGSNLFHSFEQFSIETGGSAIFSGPGSIENIIGRVTGGNVSSIDGRLASTIPGADLWLFNPAGIVFGANATLDLTGSFHVSTADQVRTADGATFSAADPESSGFSVAPPEAFGFLNADPAAISINGSQLAVGAGETLSVVGGDVEVAGNGAEISNVLLTEAGTVNLLAAGGPGEANVVTGELTGAGGDITVTDQAAVFAFGDGGGSIKIRGGEFVVDEGSAIATSNSGPSDNTGGIDVDVERLELANNGQVNTFSRGAGDSGAIAVAADAVELRDTGRIQSFAENEGAGGDIAVTADEIKLQNSGSVSSTSQAEGAGGDIAVVSETIELRNAGRITSVAEAGGDGGRIGIQTADLRVIEDSVIRSFTGASGNAGDIALDANTILLADAVNELTGVLSLGAAASTGDAGSILVTADSLILRGGAC